MDKATFWKNIGKGLAQTAKVVNASALWASQHPEVVGIVASVAGHPEVGAKVNELLAADKAAQRPGPVVQWPTQSSDRDYLG